MLLLLKLQVQYISRVVMLCHTVLPELLNIVCVCNMCVVVVSLVCIRVCFVKC